MSVGPLETPQEILAFTREQTAARERIAARLVAVVNSTQFQALLDGEMDVQEALEITEISET